MKLFKKAKKGFTLVELVVVIAVIAILSAVSVGAYFGITDSANGSRCTQEAKALHTAMTVIANDPSAKNISITKDGLTVNVETVNKGTATGLINVLSEETGITYNITKFDNDEDDDTIGDEPTKNSATNEATLWVYVGGEYTTGYYSVAGKIASIIWSTGVVTIL